MLLGVILAQASRISTAGKLDFPFRLGGHTVAGGGTIPPGAHRAEDVAVARRAHALQNQRTMHAAVGTDDETDLAFSPASIGTSRGSGVVKACGGWVSSQRERELTCGMSLNSAARTGVRQTRCSRSVSTTWCGRGDTTTGTEAVLAAGSARIRKQGQIRSMRGTLPDNFSIGKCGASLKIGTKYRVIRLLKKDTSAPKRSV